MNEQDILIEVLGFDGRANTFFCTKQKVAVVLTGVLSKGSVVQMQGENSPPYNVQFKNKWSHTFIAAKIFS
jgi:hypothetical protein